MNFYCKAVFMIAVLWPSFSEARLPPEYLFNWAWGALGVPIGARMLAHHDFDADGISEIVVIAGAASGVGPQALFVVNADLEQFSCWGELPDGFLDGIVWDVDDDAEQEIVLVGIDDIVALNWRSCEPEAAIRFSETIDAAAFGDIDGNGVLKIAFSRAGDLHVARWNDLESTQMRRGFGGDRIQVSPADELPGDDILVFNSVLRLHRGSDLGTIREFSPRPAMATTAQLIAGGESEVVTGEIWDDGITAFSLEDGSVLFNRPVFNLSTISGQDIDGDGVDEILYGNEQGGSVFVLDSAGNVLNEIPQQGFNVGKLLAADLFSDGTPEILWGASGGGNSQRLFIADLASETIVEQSASLDAPFLIGGIAEVGGRNQLVGTIDSSYESGSDPLRILIDSDTGEVEPLTEFELGLFPVSLKTAFGDVENDGSEELCLVLRERDSFIRCVRPSDLSPVISIVAPENIIAIDLLDLNGDERPEIVAAFSTEIRVFDTSTGNLLWVSEELPHSGSYAAFGFRNGALLFTGGGGSFIRIDPSNGNILSKDESTNIATFEVFNDRLVVWQVGSGLTYYDELTETIGESVYPTESEIRRISASPDTKSLIFSEGPRFSRPHDTIVISPVTRNEPLRLGTYFDYGLLITNEGTVFASGWFGMKSFKPELIFFDDFDSP